ncbi:MAG: hypothetical protein B6U68_03120, partial [Candidatus Aenigmarchaeota archaeon ex4484_14]
MRTSLLILSLIILLVFVSGCISPSKIVTSEVKECQSDADCDRGYECKNITEYAVIPVMHHEPITRKICVMVSSCQKDDDCPVTHVCVNNTCEPNQEQLIKMSSYCYEGVECKAIWVEGDPDEGEALRTVCVNEYFYETYNPDLK